MGDMFVIIKRILLNWLQSKFKLEKAVIWDSRTELFFKKDVLRKEQVAILLKKGRRGRCFPVNFTNFFFVRL